ncbi:alpha/beta hydrolase [Mycoplasma yeatsii]|uniref:alpha/beta hydrolase n=1 Tax=Mycoplasma yeatsii TaxID=51365 RepID=UPI0005B244E1|nr:alpha/beta fold hydrolase [Mycoplasma yeatsii]AJM71662.1 alpha/beta hydrolase [Mycoplasma yeatsii GM274B]
MKSKERRKILRKAGDKNFKALNKSFIEFYTLLEKSVFFRKNKKRKYIYMNPEISKMNKIMKLYFKKPQLTFEIDDNMAPIRFETEDGVVISGLKYITDPNSKKWIIGCHWFTGHKYWSLYWAKPFIELGYNVLVFDFRNHGESDSTDLITLGLLESRDLLAAIKYLTDNEKPQTIGLLGMSMGAYIINYLTVTQQEFLKKHKVKFAISESAYGSIETLLSKIWRTRIRRFFNKKIDSKIITDILKSQEKATLYDWTEMNIFDKYEKENVKPAQIPILFIHGNNDRYTSSSDTTRLFINRSRTIKNDELLIYNFSGHCTSLKEHYSQTIYRWLKFENKIINDDNATKKALEKLGIADKIIENNFNESLEISTFYFKEEKE